MPESWEKPAFTAAQPVSGCERGISRKDTTSGMENTAHQMATLTNETFTAAVASGSPKLVGYRVRITLKLNSTPPPR